MEEATRDLDDPSIGEEGIKSEDSGGASGSLGALIAMMEVEWRKTLELTAKSVPSECYCQKILFHYGITQVEGLHH